MIGAASSGLAYHQVARHRGGRRAYDGGATRAGVLPVGPGCGYGGWHDAHRGTDGSVRNPFRPTRRMVRSACAGPSRFRLTYILLVYIFEVPGGAARSASE